MNDTGLLTTSGLSEIPRTETSNKNGGKIILIQDSVREEMENIMIPNGEKEIQDLLDFLLTMEETGVIELSPNLTNRFAVEKEIKIPNIDVHKLFSNLTQFIGVDGVELENAFSGKVVDIYLDTPNKLLGKKPNKSSFRIRCKTDLNGNVKLFYTLKRKLNEEESEQYGIYGRTCFEKELEIINPKVLLKLISLLRNKPMPVRMKEKDRVSINLWGVRFDIDEYPGLPTVLEVEADDLEAGNEALRMVGLGELNNTLSVGSRGLYKYHHKRGEGPKYPKYSKEELNRHLSDIMHGRSINNITA